MGAVGIAHNGRAPGRSRLVGNDLRIEVVQCEPDESAGMFVEM